MARRAPEKVVQQSVKRALAAMGFRVSDFSQPRATMQTPGIPDLYAHHPDWGLRVWVEVKSATGTLTPNQERWIDNERKAGGVVIVARSAADLIEPLTALGAPIEA